MGAGTASHVRHHVQHAPQRLPRAPPALLTTLYQEMSAHVPLDFLLMDQEIASLAPPLALPAPQPPPHAQLARPTTHYHQMCAHVLLVSS